MTSRRWPEPCDDECRECDECVEYLIARADDVRDELLIEQTRLDME